METPPLPEGLAGVKIADGLAALRGVGSWLTFKLSFAERWV